MGLRSAYATLSPPKKGAIVAGILIFLYALFGFFVAPPIVKSQLKSGIAERLGRQVTVERIKINPFALTVTVRDFAMREPDGGPFVGFKELYVNFQLSSVLRRAYTFKEIHLIAPHGLVRVLPNGSLNFSDLIGSSDSPAPPSDQSSAAPPILIFQLQIEQGRLEFSDLSRPTPFESTFSPVQITLHNFSTRRDSESPYAFTATTGEGESLSWEGSFSVNPLRSEGRLKLVGIKARTLWKYLQDQVAFEVTGGSINVSSGYHMDASGDTIELKLANGMLNLEELKVSEKEKGAQLISLPQFSVEGADIDFSKKDAVFESVRSVQARFDAWLEPDGVFIYTKLFHVDEEDEPGKGSGSSIDSGLDTQPWMFRINELTLEDCGIRLENRTLVPPLRVNLEPLGVNVKNLSNQANSKAEVTLNLKLNKTGTVKAEGLASIKPVSAEFSFEAGEIALKPLQSYVHSVSKLDLVSGTANLNGKVLYRKMGEDGPELRYEGGLSILDFEGLNQSYTEDFIKWQSLAFNGLLFDIAPNRLHISEIVAKSLYARVIIWPDGSVNVKEVLSPQKDKGTEDAVFPVERPIHAVKSKAQGPMPIAIDLVRVENGSTNFADFSMKPNFFTGIHDINGTINGLSSDPPARAKVLLDGKVDKYAPVKIAGQINPLSPKAHVDMAMSFRNMELTPLTPYAGKFIGYAIEKGKLSLDLKYKLSENRLVGENAILLNQLTLGDRVESPDATKLPVRLAIALMKDRQGRIDIDLPVQGNLDDPKFSYGHLIVKALMKVLTKAVTSPFALLAGLVGGGGEELSFVEFEYGNAELLPHQVEKLDKLAQALQERPALQLEINGTADKEYDRTALAEKKLFGELRLRKLQELQASGAQAAVKLEQISLSEKELARLLTQKYIDTYGHHPFTETGKETPASNLAQTGARTEGPASSRIDPVLRIAMAKQRLIQDTPVDEAALQHLAQERATRIKGYLIEKGKVPNDRVFVAAVEVDAKGVSDGNTIRVNLTLSGT